MTGKIKTIFIPSQLLFVMGRTANLAAEGLGYERVQTTMKIYSHPYPNKQTEAADQLDMIAIKDVGYEKNG